jgi:DoxX-like family
MPSLRLIRISIALVWIYQGLWCKVLGQAPRHEAILNTLPLFTPAEAHSVLIALGLLECGIAVWVISGWRPTQGALLQTALLVGMNAGGLIFAARLVADPAGMLLQNFTFLLLAWIAAADRQTYEPYS